MRDAERVGGADPGAGGARRRTWSSDSGRSSRPEEVAAIRAAADLAQEALAEVLPDGPARGRRELEVGRRARGGAPPPGQRVAPVPHDRRERAAGGAAPRAHQRADRRGRASGCCLTSARRWTDTAPISPARWWSAAGRTSASGRSTSWSGRAQRRALEHLRAGHDRPGGRRAGPGGHRGPRLRRRVRPLAGARAGARGARGAAAGPDRRSARSRCTRW